MARSRSRLPVLRLLAAALALVLPLAGCSGGAGDGSGAASPRFLSVGTAPPGGAFFPVGGAIAEVLDAHADATGADGEVIRRWRVTAEATGGSQENIRRLDQGELDLALSNSAITYFAVRGTEGWDRAYDVQAVMTLAPNVALFLTSAGSGIESLADLAGERVVVGPEGAGFEYFLRPILSAHGLTYDDFSPLYGTQTATVDMLADGSAAAAFLGGAVPTASITQASASQDIVFLPFDEAARQELIDTYLFFRPAIVPAGTYRNQEEDFAGLDVGSMHLIARSDLDEATVYELTKTLWEHRAEVVSKHAAGRAINEANVVRDTGTEFHPGAVRFFREIGIWPEDEPADRDAEDAADGG